MNSRGIEEWWENGGKSGDVGKSLNDLKSLALGWLLAQYLSVLPTTETDENTV